ncbi:MAG: PP2C family serine/threonine-protein phosphatase [Actinomycetota bacterium]|nr:protein phosphatase 2C domain-containing protein [Actinomycetota bacterium]
MSTSFATPIVGASVVGASHVRAGLPCQDAFAVASGDGYVALAVADGMGSAARADAGAATAVEAALETVDDPASMIERARAALEARAASDECDVRDFACTLIVAVTRDGITSTAHIGDGAVAGLRAEGVVDMLSEPAHSEYVNEITPLTADDWRSHVRLGGPFEDLAAIAAFTDGCERAAITPPGEAHAGFFLPLFSFVRDGDDGDSAREQLAALLAGPKMTEHSDDDKTLVIAWLSQP